MLLNAINIILLVSSIIYFGYILYFFTGLQRLKPTKLRNSEDLPKLSVIVVARNEEKTIKQTLRSLAEQNYPIFKYEIIAVNDRSEDATGEILCKLKNEISNLSIINIKEKVKNISPKKYALRKAVSTAKANFIATTDADCIHDPNWLRSYASLIVEDLGVATGVTRFYKESYETGFEKIWQEMQYIEYLSHHIVAAGSIGHNKGYTANGNNQIFNKILYERYGERTLRDNIISGDDFFLIQAAEKYNYKLKFNISPEAVVKTLPQQTLRQVINQRARWASKVGNASKSVMTFSINTFVLYLGITLYPLFLILEPKYLNVFFFLIMIKIFSDTLYILYGFKKMKIKFNPKYYLLMELIHAPFIILCTLKGFFIGFSWKGSKYDKFVKGQTKNK